MPALTYTPSSGAMTHTLNTCTCSCAHTQLLEAKKRFEESKAAVEELVKVRTQVSNLIPPPPREAPPRFGDLSPAQSSVSFANAAEVSSCGRPFCIFVSICFQSAKV